MLNPSKIHMFHTNVFLMDLTYVPTYVPYILNFFCYAVKNFFRFIDFFSFCWEFVYSADTNLFLMLQHSDTSCELNEEIAQTSSAKGKQHKGRITWVESNSKTLWYFDILLKAVSETQGVFPFI